MAKRRKRNPDNWVVKYVSYHWQVVNVATGQVAGAYLDKEDATKQAKRLNREDRKLRSNPPKRDKWFPVHAVKFNKDGSVTLMKKK